MKIDKRKKYYMILDTETTNTMDDPLVYDIGYIIIDKKGTIYKMESFVVSDIFFGEKDLMKTAYYAEKLPMYYEDIQCGYRKVVNLYTARQTIRQDIESYKIQAVCAYNANFDLKAVNTTQRYITKSKYRYFIPYGVPIWCIWNMACNTICNTSKYIDFCLQNHFISNNGNIQTSAEVVYRYLIDDINFMELHTGIDDVIIEKEIFTYCIKKKGITKVEKNINRSCWQIPQQKRKELGK